VRTILFALGSNVDERAVRNSPLYVRIFQHDCGRAENRTSLEPDITSVEPGEVGAATFAAVTPRNNRN
jgi:hypothetical protein